MSADIIPFPTPERFVAILGGTGFWLVTIAIGKRTDETYKDYARLISTLPEAQAYAAEIAEVGGWPVRLMPYRGPETVA